VVTHADGNVIFELAGEKALERLQEEVDEFTERERELASQGLLAGLVIDENKPDYGRGDFLMRGILGADEEHGTLAVGESVRVGQTVRFHVRDADSAREDLELTLTEALAGIEERAAGALLFTCNGRGTNMFPEADHDVRALADRIGRPTVAGFFCGGEIGPIGGRSFLHAFTATLAIFLEPDS
jgi:small ligand-binding sensory domain FIST